MFHGDTINLLRGWLILSSDFDDDLEFVIGVDEFFCDILGGQNPSLSYFGVLDSTQVTINRMVKEKNIVLEMKKLRWTYWDNNHHTTWTLLKKQALNFFSFNNVSVESMSNGFIFYQI